MGTYVLKGEVLMGLAYVNLRLSLKKRDICWTYTMGNNEEIPDVMGLYIWIWSVGNGGQHFCKGR